MNKKNFSDQRQPSKTAEDAIVSRRSIRAFQQEPVDDKIIRRILSVASRAPSGTNTQPWKVYVVTGEVRDQLCDEIVMAYENGEEHTEEYVYAPEIWGEPYLTRRRATGWGLYGLLDIKKGDKIKMKAQHARNYNFFDAPVGIFFTIDRNLKLGSWLDCGSYLQSVMIAARGFGLDTCAQQAFAQYHKIIRKRLAIPDQEIIICGMALGYANMDEPENTFVTAREPVEKFATFVDELK